MVALSLLPLVMAKSPYYSFPEKKPIWRCPERCSIYKPPSHSPFSFGNRVYAIARFTPGLRNSLKRDSLEGFGWGRAGLTVYPGSEYVGVGSRVAAVFDNAIGGQSVVEAGFVFHPTQTVKFDVGAAVGSNLRGKDFQATALGITVYDLEKFGFSVKYLLEVGKGEIPYPIEASIISRKKPLTLHSTLKLNNPKEGKVHKGFVDVELVWDVLREYLQAAVITTSSFSDGRLIHPLGGVGIRANLPMGSVDVGLSIFYTKKINPKDVSLKGPHTLNGSVSIRW